MPRYFARKPPSRTLRVSEALTLKMKHTAKQTGVAKGMAAGVLISLIAVFGSVYFFPTAVEEVDELSLRVSSLGAAVLWPCIVLVISIGRLAKHRFFTPGDIDGSALTNGTDKARLLQSLLQNTLEQFCIALGAYTAWCFVMPISTLSAPIVCSVMFVVGRLLFFTTYRNGAAARALGFTLTFYPTVILVATISATVVWQKLS